MKTKLLVALALVIGAAGALFTFRQTPAPEPKPQPQPEVRAQIIPPVPAVAPLPAATPEPIVATAPPVPEKPAEVKTQTVAAAKPPPVPAGGLQDPLARQALGFVGADRDAEVYWISAINDPSLSADERQNLIEDLNEDGLSDPRHPATIEDMELILNRIELIEELAPFAMDQVNADAFQEAYKDLVRLWNGQGAQ